MGQQHLLWPDDRLFPEALANITAGWATDLGERVVFPWRAEGQEEQVFYRMVQLEDTVLSGLDADTLYIWIEGVAWEAEMVINDQFWGVKKCRGDAWMMGIPMKIWRQGNIRLSMTLRLAPAEPMSPKPALWITPPILLLTPEQAQVYQLPALPQVLTADSVAIVPAYYRTSGWDFDGLEALLTLQPVLDLQIKHIFFPFPADRRLRKLCAFYGLTEVAQIPRQGRVIWTAWYPMASGMSPIPEAYWLDRNAYRTQNYGVWLSLDTLVQLPGEPAGRESIVFLLLGLLLFLLFIRMVFPGMYQLQMSWLWPGRWTAEAVGDLAASLPGPLWLWILARWILWTSAISLMIMMMKDQGLWLNLRPEVTPGIAWNWMSEGQSIGGLMLRGFLLLALMDLLRYILASATAFAFGISQFTLAVVRLDMLATFPVIYLIGLPWAATILYPEYGVMGAWLGGILLVFHLLRLTLATRAGLQQFYGFSTGAIFLYICSLKVLPYMILW